jgi:hypothetical protein
VKSPRLTRNSYSVHAVDAIIELDSDEALLVSNLFFPRNVFFAAAPLGYLSLTSHVNRRSASAVGMNVPAIDAVSGIRISEVSTNGCHS